MPVLAEIDGKNEEYMQAVHKFVAKPRGFLLIAGTNGNGKSFTAKAILEHFWSPKLNNQFWNMAKLNMQWLRDVSEEGHASFLMSEILNAPLLALDDVGTRKPSEAFKDFLYWIADQRYENRDRQATIITTNLNSQSMRELMGDAFMSRIASGICIRWDGPDRRGEEF